MILYGQPEFDEGINIQIPAVWHEDAGLNFEINGEFIKRPIELEMYSPENFALFAITGKGQFRRPFYICKKGHYGREWEKMWEYFYVVDTKITPDDPLEKRRVRYTVLRPCKPGTLFCQCEECGDHFIITPSQKQFYRERNMDLPVVRDKKCIIKKKERMRQYVNEDK